MNWDVEVERLRAENAALTATLGALTTPTPALRALRQHHVDQVASLRRQQVLAHNSGWHHTSDLHGRLAVVHAAHVVTLNAFFQPDDQV